MIRTYTNLAWPDDPYRTGQQLYRRPVPRLAAFAATGGRQGPVASAIVYLPLHRTRAVAVTEQTLTFGFRVASIGNTSDLATLAAVADLDLLAARRHAAVLAGYQLTGDLAVLRQADSTAGLRGLAAVEREWADRGPAAGRAATFDCGLDLPGRLALEEACQQAGIIARPDADLRTRWQVTVGAVERALMIALVCARHQSSYQWCGTLRIGQVIAAGAWDCLPWPGSGMPTATLVGVPAAPEPVLAAGNPE